MSRRSAARASRARVSSFSLTSKLSQAVCHSSGETMGGVFTPSPPPSGSRRLSPHYLVPLVTERRSQTHRCLSGSATDRRLWARSDWRRVSPNARAYRPGASPHVSIGVTLPALYAGSVSRRTRFGGGDGGVVELGPVGLALGAGVVALAEEDGHELGSGLEVGAGLADGFHAAVELDGTGAHAVAEHAGVGLLAKPGHGRGLDLGGERAGCVGGVVEGVDLFAHRGVFVGDDPVGDLGVDEGHLQGPVAE